MERKIIFIVSLIVIIFWDNHLSTYLLLPLIVYWWFYVKDTRFVYSLVFLIPILSLISQDQVADKVAFIVFLELAIDLIRSYCINDKSPERGQKR